MIKSWHPWSQEEATVRPDGKSMSIVCKFKRFTFGWYSLVVVHVCIYVYSVWYRWKNNTARRPGSNPCVLRKDWMRLSIASRRFSFSSNSSRISCNQHRQHRLNVNVNVTYVKLEAKDVLPNINCTQAAERAEKCRFCPWWPWPLTLTFKLVRVRDQTRHPYEFGANPFSSSGDISYTNKKPQNDGANNRTFHSSLHVVKTVRNILLPSRTRLTYSIN